MCVQPTLSLAKIQLHDSAHVCVHMYACIGTWWECLEKAVSAWGWAPPLLPTIWDAKLLSLECKMHQDCLYLLQTGIRWQLHITYNINKSCRNGNWYKLLLFSHANVLLLGVSSDLVELVCTFPPRQGHVFFKAMSHALLFFYSEAQQKRSNMQNMKCRSEVINPSFWNGVNQVGSTYDGCGLTTIAWCVIAVLQELQADLLFLKSYLCKQICSSSKMEQFCESVNFQLLQCQKKICLAEWNLD